ncbi:MAG: amidase [Thermoleophilia bacterium]|nr:amidase [Thermoleophilia bacterium]
MEEIAFLSAAEQARLVAAGELSAVELVETYLGRIERLDAPLRSYVTVCAEEALAEARDPRPGPLGGVPIPVKDLTATAGIRTTYSCRAFADHVPDVDAAVVRRLKAAGAIVLGKTNTPEFGSIPVTESDLNGACRNPWDLERTPGGSSGGAAAAVAAGLAPAAHGTDGGGSLRIPASCCGLVGLKPSRGRISPAPFVSLEGLSTSGVVARTVRDAALLLDAMAGPEPGDRFALPLPERRFAEQMDEPPGRLRIALTTEPPADLPVDPACHRVLEEAAVLLASLGHHVREARPAWRDPRLVSSFGAVWCVVPALYGVQDESLLTQINRDQLARARAQASPDFVAASRRLQLAAREIVAFWADVDVVVTPTLALPPVPIGWLEADEQARSMLGLPLTPFTAVANVTGQPALSVPLGRDGDLPIGIQLIGPPEGDALILRLARQLEEAQPWGDQRPDHS